MTNVAQSLSSPANKEASGTRIVSPLMMIVALIVLLMLTAATVSLTKVDWGSTVNLWLGLGVAAVQAIVVAAYFMDLRWKNLLGGVVLVAAMFFALLFIGITVLDSRESHSDLTPQTGAAPQP